jgi:hypothetical protein
MVACHDVAVPAISVQADTQPRLLMRSHSKFSDRYDRSNENERAPDGGHARHHFPSLWPPHLDQPAYGPYDEASHHREEAQMVSSHAALRARANRRRGPLLRPMRCMASTMSASGLPKGLNAKPGVEPARAHHTGLPWHRSLAPINPIRNAR